MDRRAFFQLSAAASAPIAIDRLLPRLPWGEGAPSGDPPDGATIVGPVGLASPVRSLGRTPAGGARNRESLEGSAPSREEALASFREQIRAARGADVDAIIIPVATMERVPEAYENLLRTYEFVAELEDETFVVAGPGDLRTAVEGDRVGLILQSQGMEMIGEDVPTTGRWRAAGVSIMALTHSWKTPYGYGAFARRDLGLTPRGEEAIRAIERSGVLLDLSGVGDRTAREALAVADHPVIFSHSNAAAVHDHELNIDDPLVRGCAETGGVVGVTAFPPQVSGSERASLESVVNHVRHLTELVGHEHVAVGLDIDDRPRRRFPSDPVPDPPFGYPEQLRGFDGIGHLRSRLESGGYTGEQLRAIFGGNLARVLDRAWSARHSAETAGTVESMHAS